MTRLIHFLRESFDELRKTTWPTQQTTIQYSVIVIVSVVVCTVLFGLIDYGLSEASTKVFIGG